MTNFTWVGASAYTPSTAPLALSFSFEVSVPGTAKPGGIDTFSGGAITGFTTPARGTATSVHYPAAAFAEYTAKQVVHNVSAAIAEYSAQRIVHEVAASFCEFVFASPTGVDSFGAGTEWPIIFKSSELGQPKSVTLVGQDLLGFTEWHYLGRDMVFFGGCGFGVGDSFIGEPSYWEGEQARIMPSLYMPTADTFVAGAVSIPWPFNYVRPGQNVVTLLTGGDAVGDLPIDRLPANQRHVVTDSTGNRCTTVPKYGHVRGGFNTLYPEVLQLGGVQTYYDLFSRDGIFYSYCPVSDGESQSMCWPSTPGGYYYASYPITLPTDAQVPEYALTLGYRPTFTIEAWVENGTFSSAGIFSLRSTYDGSQAWATILVEMNKQVISPTEHTYRLHVKAKGDVGAATGVTLEFYVDVPNAVVDGASYHVSLCSQDGYLYAGVGGTVTKHPIQFDNLVRVPHTSEGVAQSGVHTTSMVLTPLAADKPYEYSDHTLYELRVVKGRALYTSNYTPQRNLGVDVL